MKRISLKIRITRAFFIFLSIISTCSVAKENGLTKEEIEYYETLPLEDQPLVPLENTFSFRGQRSTAYTLRSIQQLNLSFLMQTGGRGMSRNIGTAKMLAIINKTLEVGLHHLTEEEMDAYATSQILTYLHEINSPRAQTFYQGLQWCETKNKSCDQVISLEELEGFIEKQKRVIFAKIKKPTTQKWKRAKPKI